MGQDCAECGRAFNQHSTYARHLRTQNVEKRYKCCQCDKAFVQCGGLKRHQRVHTAVKPYECERCGETFSHPSARWLHERIHTGIPTGAKPYKCQWCSKTYARRDYLQTHERRHQRGKPHKCDKVYVQSGDFSKHEQTPISVKPFKRGPCDKAFSDSINYGAHGRIRHIVTETPNVGGNSGSSSGFGVGASSTAQMTPSSTTFAHSNATMNPMSAALMGAMAMKFMAQQGTLIAAAMQQPYVQPAQDGMAFANVTMHPSAMFLGPRPHAATQNDASSAESSVSSSLLSPSGLPTSDDDLPKMALLYPRELLHFPSRLTVPTTSAFVYRAHTASDGESPSRTFTTDNGCIGFGSHAVPKSTQPSEDTTNDVENPVHEASAEHVCPSVQPTEPGLLGAQAALAQPPPAETDHLHTSKRELDEGIDVELLDDPPMPTGEHRSSCASSSTATPSLPTLAASSSSSSASAPVAYFGDAVYDRPNDPSSFTYESDVYGSFKFVLLDEVEKEKGGQISILRLYQCKACLALSQTHEYKDEVVHTIVTSGQRIVKYDPATPRGILHLCVRHRRFRKLVG